MKRSTWGVATALVALALVTFIPQAQADSTRSSRMGANRGSAVRSVGRSVNRSHSTGISQRSRSGSPGLSHRSFGRSGRSDTPSFGNRDSSRSFNGYQGAGRGALGGLLREGLQQRLGDGNRYGGYGDGRGARLFDYLEDREDARSDAYRDAMIADSIVRIVGIIATAPRTQARYVAPGPYVAAPSPGHYETRRVIVRAGYWQEEQVWVPEWQDPSSGSVVAGHYETHKRWVPEVYEETQVWVPHQTPVPYRR